MQFVPTPAKPSTQLQSSLGAKSSGVISTMDFSADGFTGLTSLQVQVPLVMGFTSLKIGFSAASGEAEATRQVRQVLLSQEPFAPWVLERRGFDV